MVSTATIARGQSHRWRQIREICAAPCRLTTSCIGLTFQLWGTFSGGLGAGLGGVGSHLDFAGPRCSLAFFGFFASRPRLSRLPMALSLDVDVTWPLRILQNALFAGTYFRVTWRCYSRRTTPSRDLLIFRPPLYSMKPSLLNLFMKKFMRVRVVPTISAKTPWETLGSVICWFCLP